MHDGATKLRLAPTEQVPRVYDPLGDEAGLAVRRCQKISGEDKLAWGFLRVRSKSGREQLRISGQEVGEHQGVTNDAGRQRLKNLEKAGLIFVTFKCRKTGLWTLQVLDPLAVLKSDVRFVPADPQLVLPFGDEESSTANRADQAPSERPRVHSATDAPSWSAETGAAEPAIGLAPRSSYTGGGGGSSPRFPGGDEEPSEEPPEVPRSRLLGLSGLSGPSVLGSSISRPLTISGLSGPSGKINHSEVLAAEEPRHAEQPTRRGTSGPSSPAECGEDDLASIIRQRRQEQGLPSGEAASEMAIRTAASIGAAMAFRTPSPAEQARHREQWIDIITRRVRDPLLKACVKVKVAAAVVAGELKASEVEEVFAEIDKHRRAGTLRGPAGIYFLRAAQALFRRHGLDWTGYGHGGRRKPR
jgi:hypothetical protein